MKGVPKTSVITRRLWNCIEMTASGTLDSLFGSHLKRAPDDVMLIEAKEIISYRQFEQRVQETSVWLLSQGIRPGDHVAVWLINRVEWLVLLFALARIGATLVAVNTKYRAHELQYILHHSQASTLILQLNFKKIDFAEVIKEVDTQTLTHLKRVIMLDTDSSTPSHVLSHQVITFDPRPVDESPKANLYARTDSTLADKNLIFFTTSGTTKGPKLVIHTQRTLSEHAKHVATGYGFGQANDKLLAALPLCGVFGLNSALGAIAAGMPIVLMDFFDGASASALLQQEHITHIFGSDEMLRRLIEHIDQGSNVATAAHAIPFPSLKTFGFAAFGPRFLDLARTLIPRAIPMRGLYGSSEVHALFSLQDAELTVSERVLGGGRPAAGKQASVRARDPSTGEVCVDGLSGELEIRSSTLFKGYFNNAQATSDAFTADGFFKTGDLGYTRPDGSFVYQSRMGDTMRLGGFLVDPSEIEQVLAEQSGIESAQVVGIEIDGQLRPVAFAISAMPGQTPDEAQLLKQMRGQLAAFKVPVHIWFVEAFPSTASANGLKFQRVKLREMALARLSKV